MRIRRVHAEWDKGQADLDCRGEGGFPLPVVGIIGNNGSGKTLLMNMVSRLYSDAINPRAFLDWDDISGWAEFEYHGAIAAGRIEKGKVVQRLVFPDMKKTGERLEDSMLVYGHSFLLNGNKVEQVLHDLYRGMIKNCLIWVDNFDRSLDRTNSSKFLQVLIKKALEGNNQLVVSSYDKEVLEGIGWDNQRVLTGGGEDIVERAMVGLNKPNTAQKPSTAQKSSSYIGY